MPPDCSPAKRTVQQWIFHQAEKELTTRRAGDIAPATEKVFKIPIPPNNETALDKGQNDRLRSPQLKRWLLAIALCGLSLGLLLTGFLAGRYTVKRTFREEIRTMAKVFTLGNLLVDEKQRKGVANAYYDSAHIEEKLNDISWGVDNSPAPFVGHAPKPGVHNNARINSMQFRADHEVVMPKPKALYRIFFTGGSTAYGSGAPSQESTIAVYLNRLLEKNLTPKTNKNYEVITAANPAWASTHERIFIENRLSELQPDMIISFSGNNDVHWGWNRYNILWFRSYYDELFFKLLNEAYRLAGEPSLPEVTQIEKSPVAPDLVAARLLKNVRISSYVLGQQGTDYVFVLQPTLAVSAKRLTERGKSHLGAETYFRECYAKIDEALRGIRDEKFLYVNLTGIFDGMDKRHDIFIDSYHFGDKGNEIIAQQIFLRLAEHLSRL